MDLNLQDNKLWESLFIETSLLKPNDGEKIENNLVRTFDTPASYVLPLLFHRNDYLIRYPAYGKRTINFYCAKVDYYSRTNNSQCMVMRITHYLEPECITIKEIYEWYDNRKDKLYKRIRYYLNTFHFIEYYHPGKLKH